MIRRLSVALAAVIHALAGWSLALEDARLELRRSR